MSPLPVRFFSGDWAAGGGFLFWSERLTTWAVLCLAACQIECRADGIVVTDCPEPIQVSCVRSGQPESHLTVTRGDAGPAVWVRCESIRGFPCPDCCPSYARSEALSSFLLPYCMTGPCPPNPNRPCDFARCLQTPAYPALCVVEDRDGDCDVDLFDFAQLQNEWRIPA